MNKLVDDIIRERRRGGGDQSQKDLLNFMLAGVDKATGESLSDENIRYQINTFLIAGHETTSGLLSFTLYFLVNNADVLAEAYEEVDRVLGNDLAVQPTISAGQPAHLCPADPERGATALADRAGDTALYPYKDEVIGGQYKIKKGTFITLLTLMLHRDPVGVGTEAGDLQPRQFFSARRRPRGPPTPSSRGATASAPASAASSPCRKRRWCSA